MVNWIVSSSVLIICVVLIRRLLKGRISPGLQYALWGIVLLRLLIPINFGNSKISVENFTENITEAYESEVVWEEDFTGDYSYSDAYVVSADSTLIKSDIGEVLDNSGKAEQHTVSADIAEVYSAAETAEVPVDFEKKTSAVDVAAFVIEAAVYIWVAGMVAVALVFIYTNLRFVIRTSKDRELIVDKEKGMLPVYYSDSVETPCLYGILNPRIYVNSEVFNDEHVFKHVKEHELTHYHHGDNIWCVFRFMALVVHWYNPLVWLAAVLSRKDSELACDEGTIKRLGEEERVGYGMTLINMSCKKRDAVFTMATTMAGSKKNIQERVVLIAKKPKTAMRTLVAVVLVMAAIVGVTFTGAVKVVELPLIKAEKQDDSAANTESLIVADKIDVADYTVTSENPPNISCVVGTGSYPVGTGVSYITDMYDRVMYGIKGSFVEIYADRTGMEFRLLDESDVENKLIKAVYDMYNSEGLKITLYDKRTTPLETYTSYSPDNAEHLADLISQYTWKQVDASETVESDYMIEISAGGVLFRSGNIRFYDVGDGVVSYCDGRNNTYWKAIAKSANTASITERLREDYYNIELELIRMVISGFGNEKEAFKYFIEVAYPSTRLNLEDGNPYKISNYKLRGSSRETTKGKQVREGDFTFTCIPEGGTKPVERTVTYTVEATEDGTWIFQYHDCDKE